MVIKWNPLSISKMEYLLYDGDCSKMASILDGDHNRLASVLDGDDRSSFQQHGTMVMSAECNHTLVVIVSEEWDQYLVV